MFSPLMERAYLRLCWSPLRCYDFARLRHSHKCAQSLWMRSRALAPVSVLFLVRGVELPWPSGRATDGRGRAAWHRQDRT